MTSAINKAFEAQQTNKYLLRATTAAMRAEKLGVLKNAIQKHEKELFEALHTDLGKSIFEATVTEIQFIYGEIDHAVKHLKRWMKPVKVASTPSTLFARNRIFYEPKGVCLIIAPWNYPFQLVMSPLISAIAAGNCAIVKPSEISPATSKVIAKIISSAFETREIACFEGDAGIAATLLSLPFDHIFFTGSTAIGKEVMAAAAKNLTSVTLELGGKSPAIITSTADVEKAAQKIAWGKLVNVGQTCIAPDYVLVQETKLDAFVEAFKRQALEMFYTGEGNPNPAVYGKIISQKHFNRLTNLVRQAVDEGATVAFGGGTDKETLRMEPVVLLNVKPESAAMQEELFGPVLPVITYKELPEAINFVNTRPKPLALYLFDNEKSTTKSVLQGTSAGGSCVNDVLIHISNPRLPFGGVNSSGMGSCHGIFGFKTFSHERAVMFQSKIDFTSFIYPPYAGKDWILKILKKIM